MKLARILLAAVLAIAPANINAAELVFCGNTDGQFDLYHANLKTAEIRRISETPSEELMPAVSADGSKLVFVSDRAGANSLYMMPLNGTASQTENISAGIGAYANPSFSPDGAKIAVQYAPDPEDVFHNTKIVVLDPVAKKQEVLVDSTRLKTSENSETVTIVDRPQWVSESLLVYVLSESPDPSLGRVSKSTIYMYDLKKQQHVRVAGGESYFDMDGKPMGFKAALPHVFSEKDRTRTLIFTAIRGATDREPMKIAIAGGGKGLIELEDPQYFGPLLFVDSHWIYGTMDDEGNIGLAWRVGDLKAEKQALKFSGKVIYPAIVR